MRHLAHLALAACIALTGSVTDAAPRRTGRNAKVVKASKLVKKARKRHRDDDQDLASAKRGRKHRVDDDRDEDRDGNDGADEDPATEITGSKRLTGRAKSDRIAFESHDPADESDADLDTVTDPAADTVEVEAPVKLHRHAGAKRAKDWHVAVGPYLWASSVDANVSIGLASVGSSVDFMQMTKHARYGAEMLAEARYRRFAMYGDLMYGVVDVNGGTTVGPLMVGLQGTASSLLVDGLGGYTVLGGEESKLSLEARGGVRYQRTAITASVNVSGAEVSPPEQVSAAADAVAGARATLRPSRRFAFSGALDIGVAGTFKSTWSVSADASMHVTSRLLLSLGWQTLTMDSANVSLKMHGPRAAIQLVF